MKTVLYSFLIFIIFIVCLIFSIGYLNKACTELKAMDVKIEQHVVSDSWNEAYNDSENLMNKWSKYSKILSIFISHQEVDNINSELWKLISYVKTKEKPEALASTYVIKFYMKHIIDMEKINLENVL